MNLVGTVMNSDAVYSYLTSYSVGKEGTAPLRCTESAAAAVANSVAATSDRWSAVRSKEAAKAPTNASPAPVVSKASTASPV